MNRLFVIGSVLIMLGAILAGPILYKRFDQMLDVGDVEQPTPVALFSAAFPAPSLNTVLASEKEPAIVLGEGTYLATWIVNTYTGESAALSLTITDSNIEKVLLVDNYPPIRASASYQVVGRSIQYHNVSGADWLMPDNGDVVIKKADNEIQLLAQNVQHFMRTDFVIAGGE